MPGFAIYAVTLSLLSYIVGLFWMRLDEEESGGIFSIVTDGGFTAVAVFILSWVLSYTALVDPELLNL